MPKSFTTPLLNTAEWAFAQHAAGAFPLFGIGGLMRRRVAGGPLAQSFSDSQLRDIGMMRGDLDPVHLAPRYRAEL